MASKRMVKPPANMRADGREVEQGRHQRLVVGDRIEHLDRHPADLGGADAVEVEVGRVQGPVFADGLGAGEDRVGDLLRRRAAIADIVLDAEIAVRPAGIVAGGEDDAAEGLAAADHAEAAGVESRPPWPTSTRPKPLAAAIRITFWTTSRL